jgi:hypothetical protein
LSERERRVEAVVLLLRSLHDYDLQPLGWTAKLVARQARRGQVASQKILCPACDGERERRVRGVLVACDQCLSARSGKPLGWIYVDANMNEPFRRKIGSEETGAFVRVHEVPCDACGGDGSVTAGRWRGENNKCLRCGGSGKRISHHGKLRPFRGSEAEPAAARSGDPRLDAMEERERAGSYRELGEALEALHGAWAALFRLVCEVYVHEAIEPEALEAPLAHLLQGGLAFLEARMPDEIVVPASARLYERRRRKARSETVAA